MVEPVVAAVLVAFLVAAAPAAQAVVVFFTQLSPKMYEPEQLWAWVA